MTCRADAGMLPCLKRLWIDCFGDSEEYTDYIFNCLIKPEHAFVATEGGHVSSMLFYQPFTLKTQAAKTNGAYIFGVATEQKSRGEGISTRLLDYTHECLENEGYALSVLVPANEGLFEFYAKRGYSNFSDICRVTLQAEDIPITDYKVAATPVRLDRLYPLREEYFNPSTGFVSWDEHYLDYQADELERFGGETLLLEYGNVKGYAVCFKHKDEIYVKELAFPKEMLNLAVAAIHEKYHAFRYNYSLRADFHPVNASVVLPYSMKKWYDINNSTRMEVDSIPPSYISFALD